MTEAKTRLDRIQQMTDQRRCAERNGARHFEQLEQSVIVTLRSQYRDLPARVTEIEFRVGSEHMAVVKLRSRMDEVGRAIRDEEQRIVASYASEYQIAKARNSELAAAVAQVSRGSRDKQSGSGHDA